MRKKAFDEKKLIDPLRENEKEFFQQRRKLEIQARIVRKILQSLDLEEQLNYILDEVMKLLKVEIGGVYLVDNEELILHNWRGIPGRILTKLLSYPLNKVPRFYKEQSFAYQRPEEQGEIFDLAKQEGIQTMASIPLKNSSKVREKKDDWLGTIMLASRRYDAFSSKDIEIVKSIGDQIALAIDHYRQFHHATKRLDRLETLRKIDRSIIANLSTQEILKMIMDHVPKELGADAVAISLYNQENRKTEVFTMRLPNGTIVKEEAFSLAESLEYQIIDHQEPLIITDLCQDKRLQIHEEFLKRQKLTSYLGVPLIVEDETVGILHLLTYKPTIFQNEDVKFFQVLAGQAAIAIKNAQLIEKLHESEEKFRSIAASAQDAIIMMDDEGKITFWNKAAEEIFGYSEKEVQGKEMQNLIFSEPYYEKFKDDFAKFRETGRIPNNGRFIEITAIKRDGIEFPMEISVSRVKLKGLWNTIAIGRDVTERRQLETQLLHSQKTEAIGRLASGIAHDFNNVLTSIMGHADLMLMRIGKENDLREDIGEIKKAADRAVSLTRQLLIFSRKQVIQPTILNLRETIVSMKKMLKRLIGENIEFNSNLDPHLGKVNADPGQIDQLIMNLVVNARDAMPQGGKLTIEATNVDLDSKYFRFHGITGSSGPYVLIAVSDTGIGIDKELQSKIFDPFFTTKEKGTGLGLSIVYGMVKQNNGFIWVYSEPGKGTSVKVYLPRVEASVQKIKTKDFTKELNRGSETILLVEDDESVRGLAAKVLTQLGYNVLEAKNGKEAIRISTQYKGTIHLLLTDLVMPGISGNEVIKHLTAERPEMKAIYMSGYPDDIISHHGILNQKTKFLQKPFSPVVLAKIVREILDNRK